MRRNWPILAVISAAIAGFLCLAGLAVVLGLTRSRATAGRTVGVGACDPGTSFSSLTSPEFGFSIEYPQTWFLESYKPGQRFGTGNPGPEYMIALSTIDHNFDPAYSLGSESYSNESEVVQVFVSRGSKDSSLALKDFEGPEVLAQLANLQDVKISGLAGIQFGQDPSGLEWGNLDIELDQGGYVISLETAIWGGKNYSNCKNLVTRVLDSFQISR